MNTVSTSKQYFEIVLEDGAVVSDIKKAIKMIRGVASIRVATPAKASELNATTIKAIKDVKAGKTHKASSVDDLIAQCLS